MTTTMAAEVAEAVASPTSEQAVNAARPAVLPVHRERWFALTLGLLCTDAVALVAAFGLAYAVRFKTGLPLLETPPYSGAFYSSVAFWSVPIWLGLFAAFRLYDRSLLFAGFHEYARIANACTTGMVVEVMLSFLEVQLPISRGWLLLTWLLSMVLVAGTRFLGRRALRVLHRAGHFRTPTLIIGTNGEGRALAEQFLTDTGAEPHVLGFLDNSLPIGTPVFGGLAVVGSSDDLREVIQRLGARQVIVASTAVSREELLDVYRTVSQDNNVQLRLSSGLFEILTTGMQVHEISSVPLMTPRRVRITGADAAMKTALDYMAAFLALVVLSPVIVLISLLVWLDSGRPIFHRRRVLGVSGKTFDAFKFRTMMVNAERRQRPANIPFPDRRLTFKGEGDPRVTRIGQFLRRTSLDELPQLVNVLRGEMSLVGPRMIAPDEWTRYGKWQHNLLTVKPGITGPWQIQGRGDIAYDERVRLSMHYIRNYSIWLDLEILVRTVLVVVQGRGAY
jgi:exopolysaccharide biosynthesis polyprenyl glycosylphosphotransferase